MKDKLFEKPPSLVRLDSLDDLKRVLFTQKTIAQEVRREMMALATSKELATGKLSGPEEARRICLGQIKLLEKYSSYPTLSEFSFHPSLIGATKWGATFGVIMMAKTLVIDQIKALMPQFAPFIRNMYVLILKELDNPTHQYLVEPLEEALRFRITTEKGEVVEDQRSKNLTKAMLYKLAENLLLISVQYGIVEGAPFGFAITDMGRRVLLHIVDADTFLTELAAAHKRFQDEKPKLQCI